MQWVDDTTYVDLTRPWYSRAVGLPFSLFLPNTKRKRVIAQLHAPYSGNPILSDADLENQVFTCLSVILLPLAAFDNRIRHVRSTQLFFNPGFLTRKSVRKLNRIAWIQLSNAA